MTNTLNNITVSVQSGQSDDACAIQLCAFYLNADERVGCSEDFIRATNNRIAIDLVSVQKNVSQIVFTVTISETEHSFGETDAVIRVDGNGIQEDRKQYHLELSAESRALFFGRFIRNENRWTWEFVARDSNDTLDEIAQRYGCVIAPVPPTPPTEPAAPPSTLPAPVHSTRSPLESWEKRHRQYICPYCANEVASTNWYRCCKGKSCDHTFQAPYEDKTARCPHDNTITAIRLCPNEKSTTDENGNTQLSLCRQPLWRNFENATTAFIGIIGSTGSGKTHFLTVLIEELRRQCDVMGWNTVHLMGDTITMESELYRELYIDRRILPATNPNETEKMKPFRLLLERSENSEKTKDINLVFFDAAGEHYTASEGADITELHEYLGKSAGIILLLDMDGQEPRDPAEMESLSESRKSKISVQRTFLDTLRKTLLNMGVDTKKIPLAITLSKADEKQEFMTLMETKDTTLTDDWSRYRNIIRTWFEDDRRVISNRRAFHSEFFAVSALGKAPKRKEDRERDMTIDVVPGGPSPIHVLDPLLWILNEQQLLENQIGR